MQAQFSETVEDIPNELSHAGAVIDKAIEYLSEQDIPPMAIASALLGGSLGLLARTMSDEAILQVLANAAHSVRNGALWDDVAQGRA